MSETTSGAHAAPEPTIPAAQATPPAPAYVPTHAAMERVEPVVPPGPAYVPTHAAETAVTGLSSPPLPVGKIRSTGVCILLAVVTFGIYPVVWYFMVHDEMKRHSNQGLGGGLALLLALVVGVVMPYLTASEVGRLYEQRGLRRPVSGATGLWCFPGAFLLVGPLVWFIKTNGALNGYWRSFGAR